MTAEPFNKANRLSSSAVGGHRRREDPSGRGDREEEGERHHVRGAGEAGRSSHRQARHCSLGQVKKE